MENLKYFYESHKKEIYLTISIIIIIFITSLAFFLINKKYNKNEIITNISSQIEEKNTGNIDENEITKTIKVDIKGFVTSPGVYELKENDRVIDVINLAGGLLENANTRYLNLSKKLEDETVVIINSNEEIAELKTKEPIPCENINSACLKEENIITSSTKKEENKEKSGDIKTDTKEEALNTFVNINTADIKTLMTLKGIGESKAEKIIDYRNTNGNFEKIEDIKKVSGIGDSIYEKIKNNITV